MNEKYNWPPLSSEQPPPLQNSPILVRPVPPTVTVINSPPNKKRLSIVGKQICDKLCK